MVGTARELAGGGIMLRNYKIVENGEFKGYLKELLERECLDGPAVGITKLAISNGIKSLSPKQLEAFKTFVLNVYTVDGCALCESEIPWSDMYRVATGSKLCSHCESTVGPGN
jgi:hypothetical protein